MEKLYFVETILTNGHRDRWEYLTQQQANAVYADQVQDHGINRVCTGGMPNPNEYQLNLFSDNGKKVVDRLGS